MTFFCSFFKVLDEFSKQVDSIDWPSGSPETINYKALDIHLSKYQVSFYSAYQEQSMCRGIKTTGPERSFVFIQTVRILQCTLDIR